MCVLSMVLLCSLRKNINFCALFFYVIILCEHTLSAVAGDTNGAIEKINEALRYCPTYHVAFFNLGLIYRY